jgi:hypothetical protein
MRASKVKTPPALLRVALLYGGLDQSLRTGADHLTLLGERITDSSVMARLPACKPWIKALLPQLLPSLPVLPTGSRLSVIDGSSVKAPGADDTDYRFHRRLDWRAHYADATSVRAHQHAAGAKIKEAGASGARAQSRGLRY